MKVLYIRKYNESISCQPDIKTYHFIWNLINPNYVDIPHISIYIVTMNQSLRIVTGLWKSVRCLSIIFLISQFKIHKRVHCSCPIHICSYVCLKVPHYLLSHPVTGSRHFRLRVRMILLASTESYDAAVPQLVTGGDLVTIPCVFHKRKSKMLSDLNRQKLGKKIIKIKQLPQIEYFLQLYAWSEVSGVLFCGLVLSCDNNLGKDISWIYKHWEYNDYRANHNIYNKPNLWTYHSLHNPSLHLLGHNDKQLPNLRNLVTIDIIGLWQPSTICVSLPRPPPLYWKYQTYSVFILLSLIMVTNVAVNNRAHCRIQV